MVSFATDQIDVPVLGIEINYQDALRVVKFEIGSHDTFLSVIGNCLFFLSRI